MVSLIDEDVGSDQGQGGGADRADRGKRLLDRSEHFHDPSQRPIPLVAHIGASRGGELRADEDRPIVGDVLDHAETQTRTHRSWSKTFARLQVKEPSGSRS